MRLVSVIIPTRNRAPLLREAIESVLAVKCTDFEHEVIVVDDGSTDDTPAIVRAYPISYLRLEGRGASAARNAGMAAAHGDFIAFLDDDDVWLPTNITPQLAMLDAHPEYGAAYAQVQLTDIERVPYGEPVPAGPLRSGWIFDDLLTHWPQVDSLVVRAAVVREIGGFDVALCSEEEWDWILRIARRYPIGRIEQPVALFRQRGFGDEAQAWQRLPDTLAVFHRHTQARDLSRWLRFRRILWMHRGWYAASFLGHARQHTGRRDIIRALRCVEYAVLASPAHTLALLARHTLTLRHWRKR